jgi:hypothetical protein
VREDALSYLLRLMSAAGGYTAGVYGDRYGGRALLLLMPMTLIVHFCLRTIVEQWRRDDG